MLRLNFHATLIPTMVFGEAMARARLGVDHQHVVDGVAQALSGVIGYSVAKAGIDNFTRWMAVEMARKHTAPVRVNAIAPGFFVAEQNRAVLIKPDGESLRARRKSSRARRWGASEIRKSSSAR